MCAADGTCFIACTEPDTFMDCDGVPDNGCEADTSMNDCGCFDCGPNSDCRGRCTCQSTSLGRYADCNGDTTMGEGVDADGCETRLDVVTDCNRECGSPGTDCTSAPRVGPDVACTDRGCVTGGSCEPGFGDCDGAWVNGCEADFRSEITCGTNCGDFRRCAAGERCVDGACM